MIMCIQASKVMRMTSIAIWLNWLFRQHNADLVRYAARLVGSRDIGEEIAQDTYMRLAGRAASAPQIDHPKTYLYRAARNAAIDHTARQKVEWSYRADV
jgi:DNA-directed RNA polymerase specialized sigma24 family protein